MTTKAQKDEVYRIKDGRKLKVDNPKSGFGKQIITWQNGKITNVEVSYTEK